MGHGQAEVDDLRRNQARRARLAGPDGEPVVPEGAVGFVRSRRDLARFFEKDQAETVRRVITEGLEQGQSLKQVMGSLEEALPGKMGRARLENIARTEATTAYNQGRLAMFLDTEGFIAGVEFMAIDALYIVGAQRIELSRDASRDFARFVSQDQWTRARTTIAHELAHHAYDSVLDAQDLEPWIKAHWDADLGLLDIRDRREQFAREFGLFIGDRREFTRILGVLYPELEKAFLAILRRTNLP